MFDVEFLLGRDEKLYFTEINFRVDGEIYKLVPGINLPECWCNLLELSEDKLPDRLKTNKKYFVGITELDDFKVSVMSGQVNILIWLWQFLTADRRMLVNIKDPKPLLIKIWDLIKMRIYH